MRREPQRPVTITRVEARRLAISRQRLAAPPLTADPANLQAVFRSLGYVQLDPVNVVAPSHQLVLWSRLGPGAAPHLDTLLWRDRWLFEYWLHAAAIVLTEDYPLYRTAMNAYPGPAMRTWMDANGQLRKHIMHRLQEDGPLPTAAFEDRAAVDWQSTGWTNGRNVERMLQFLWLGGEIMVAGRAGGQRRWGLPGRCLPAGTSRSALPLPRAVAAATEHALRALGVAREADVKQYCFRKTSPPLHAALRTLEKQGRVVRAEVEGQPPAAPWFMHVDALDTLAAIRAGDWAGRTTLLSPFDNLISDRGRTERLWDFSFRNEMYVPKAKRRYGYFVMPVLHDDQLAGRVVPRADRRRGVLQVEGLYLEPGVRATATLCRAITGQLAALATLAGVTEVTYGDAVPDRWRGTLHRS